MPPRKAKRVNSWPIWKSIPYWLRVKVMRDKPLISRLLEIRGGGEVDIITARGRELTVVEARKQLALANQIKKRGLQHKLPKATRDALWGK